MKIDIILCGVGGQGILSIATVIGEAAIMCGYNMKQAEVHGMSQRGGSVQSNLRISDQPIHSDLIPLGGANLILSLEPMESLRYLPYLDDKGWLVTNAMPFVNISGYPEMSEIAKEIAKIDNSVALDIDEVAKKSGSPLSANMVLLGAATPFIDIDIAHIEAAIRSTFGHKGAAVVDINITALRAGRKIAEDKIVNG